MDTKMTYLCITLLLLCITEMMCNTLNICAWNVRSLSLAKPYIQKLCQRNEIMFIAEHRLYSKELYKLYDLGVDYDVYAKSSKDLKDINQSSKPGHCGVAMMWSRSLSHRVRTIECESDRICAIELMGLCNERSIFIIGVYMPHQRCIISDFNEELNVLSDLVCKCKQEGEVVIIGDTNCNFGSDVTTRFTGVTTRNAKSLLEMIKLYDLEIFDGCDICRGPMYTFEVEGVGSSYIDHCLGSMAVWDRVIKCEIIADDIINTSDHLPITITIRDDDVPIKNKIDIKNTQIAWGRLDDDTIQELYTNQLDAMLEQLHDTLLNDEVRDAALFIDNAVKTIVECIKKVATNLPQKKFNGKLKPYWNKNLTLLSKERKKIWHNWVDAGRPRGGKEIFKQYKEAKRNFREALGEAIREYETKEMKDINESNEMNLHHFWYLVNRKKKKKGTTIHPIKSKTGRIISDPNEINEEWKKYFQDLYTPKENEVYDAEFK